VTIKWIADCVVRIVVDGNLVLLYQGVEIEVLEENQYILDAIVNGLAEIV
jgi:hypothetical protein